MLFCAMYFCEVLRSSAVGSYWMTGMENAPTLLRNLNVVAKQSRMLG